MPKGMGLKTQRDPRSRAFGAAHLLARAGEIALIAAEPKAYVYHRLGPILDQGQTSACSGYAARQAAYSGPIMQRDGPTAYDLYRANCERDARVFGTPLSYDGGATLDSAAAVMKDQGWLDSYWWTAEGEAGADQAIEWVCRGGGVLMGSPWTSGMDAPSAAGNVTIAESDAILGYHAFYLSGANRKLGTWKAPNSWGLDFGDRGVFRGSVASLRAVFKLGAYGACLVERRAS